MEAGFAVRGGGGDGGVDNRDRNGGDQEGGSGNDTLRGTDNADMLRGGSDDTLYSRDGADLLEGDSGSGNIFAGCGGDAIYADDGYRDYIDCGSGFERVQRDNFDRVAGCGQSFSRFDYHERVRGVTVSALLGSNKISVRAGQITPLLLPPNPAFL